MKRHIGLFAGFGILLLSGCATPPSPELESARTEVDAAKGDATIMTNAPAAVMAAEDAILKADAAKNLEEREHQAQLASLRVQLARLRSERRMQEQRAEEAAKQVEAMRMQARGREVEAARRREQEAERREALLRAQAEGERQRTEMERERRAQSATELANVQAELTELKPKLSPRGLELTLGEVLFDYDSAELKPYAERIMVRLASFLTANPQLVLRIEGHTDNQGDAQDNLVLSTSRAAAVAQSLIDLGIDSARITAVGLGETRPIASNETTTGRQENRRVEIIITEPA